MPSLVHVNIRTPDRLTDEQRRRIAAAAASNARRVERFVPHYRYNCATGESWESPEYRAAKRRGRIRAILVIVVQVIVGGIAGFAIGVAIL